MLTGAVVQLKLSCNGFAADEHCLSFRVAGVSGPIPQVLPSNSFRLELLLVFVLLFLLVLSIGGSLLLWQMCWRIKKQKLISSIQMQFLLHLQQQQEIRKVAMTQAAVNDMGPCEFKTLMERIPKRRLYFSAEYLDREMMENPPPMAEQFLTDLRRVIEIARERIRMRRFVPMLITIPEDLEEGRNAATGEDNVDKGISDMYQESPKSDKSVDSGRESRSDSDDSSRDGEEEEKTKEWAEEHNQEDRVNNVRSIVNGFESQSDMRTPAQQNRPTRVLTKTPTAMTKTQLHTSKIPTILGRSSPRPLQKPLALAQQPPLPRTPPPRTPAQCRTRRGYAVFPADPMLNKSLPRRKRTTPRLMESAAASNQ
ncbi:hypothetical protein KIN20_037571 [Parelaphostrongylus tenuis]|uniref:Uncharacterized protein n=1 Tax=Parelaphostrongylus tenuis TaxID=148309 RepID=A0AAD5RI65_PARTN|nr:hypothetical protein KIN20_037571 [Parelaphostrongylus tenuis]